MDFRAYPKTPTRYDGPVGGRWIATEKLHGAHLVIAVDGAVRFANRKQWLEPDTPFFGWSLLARDLGDRVRELVSALGVARAQVHGELYGGGYPHPDVAPVPGLSPVQTGVWYAPDLRWAAFAILLVDEGEWLAFHEVESLARAAGIEVPPVVGRGTRPELDRLPVSAQTRVPARLGLPEIEGNVGEGLVFVPDRRMPADRRVAVKRKIAEFDDERFGEAVPHDPGELSPDVLLGWAGRLVNPARFASARSKVGADPAAVVDEVALDVAQDLQAAFPRAWAALGSDGEWALLDRIRDLARAPG